MKYLRGFLMAWGCFCWIPCPYKQWNDDDREAMVAMLPLVGTGLALITGLVWAAVSMLGAPAVLAGAVVTAGYFVMTGFIHLDGFMDVCDAVMPRHPKLEVRRRILKDPHAGSFAAVSMALMLLIFAASAAAMSGSWLEGTLTFIAVATTSRCVSAVTVLSCRPMETSQYVTGDFGTGRAARKAAPALIITAAVLAGCVLLSLHLPALNLTQAPLTQAPLTQALPGQAPAIIIPASAAVCALTGGIIGALDRRSLGGMNGDISGHMITSGEMAGMLAGALLLG